MGGGWDRAKGRRGLTKGPSVAPGTTMVSEENTQRHTVRDTVGSSDRGRGRRRRCKYDELRRRDNVCEQEKAELSAMIKRETVRHGEKRALLGLHLSRGRHRREQRRKRETPSTLRRTHTHTAFQETQWAARSTNAHQSTTCGWIARRTNDKTETRVEPSKNQPATK